MACQERASARPRGQGRLLTHTPERYLEGQQEVMGGRLVGAGSGGRSCPGSITLSQVFPRRLLLSSLGNTRGRGSLPPEGNEWLQSQDRIRGEEEDRKLRATLEVFPPDRRALEPQETFGKVSPVTSSRRRDNRGMSGWRSREEEMACRSKRTPFAVETFPPFMLL